MVWLGHKGRCFAVDVRHVLNNVLLHQRPVSALNQGRETRADLALTCTGHFVVMHLNRDTNRLQDLAHLVAHVHGAVNRWNGEVATLDAGTVTTVTTL